MIKTIKIFSYIVLAAFCGQAVGINEPEGRIIGGHAVEIFKHPYLVSIRSKFSNEGSFVHEYAGSIYSSKVVITGAQCINHIQNHDLVLVVAGATTRSAGDGQIYPARRWIAHENYNLFTVDNDIGLIFIEGEFDFTQPSIQPISIIENRPPNDGIATIAGWGYRDEVGPSSNSLEEALVPIVSDEACKAVYGDSDVTSRMICAGNLVSGGKDACQGDSSGPLVYRGQLVGLVSWGRGCGRPNYPTVYTFVRSFTSWIDQKISQNSR